MINLTLEERERFWYILGWPLQATPEDVGQALSAESWENAAGDHDLCDPSELSAALEKAEANRIKAETLEEALRSLAASAAMSDALADVISEFLKAPELHDFDRLLDQVLT